MRKNRIHRCICDTWEEQVEDFWCQGRSKAKWDQQKEQWIQEEPGKKQS